MFFALLAVKRAYREGCKGFAKLAERDAVGDAEKAARLGADARLSTTRASFGHCSTPAYNRHFIFHTGELIE